MRTKEEIIADIEVWTGVNKYIVQKCKLELRELESQPEPEPVKEVKKLKVKDKRKYTETELMTMNKAEQSLILKNLGCSKVPYLEKGRVSEILKLQ